MKRLIGPYELGKRLGHGGQGEVYRATDSRSAQVVALKLFQLGFDDDVNQEARRRVHREVTALRRVSHPSIVRVIDDGEAPVIGPVTKGYLYIAYELIDGYDLSDVLSRPLAPDPDDVVNGIVALAKGLAKAHSSDILHRDIKPANVILRGSAWTNPVLVDFGCVHLEGASTLTRTIHGMGTINYMAPEVRASVKNASTASDQWSLARVALECVAVAVGDSYDDVRSASYEELLDNGIAAELPGVGECLRSALTKDPRRRHSTVSAFATTFVESAERDGWVESVEASSPVASAVTLDESVVSYLERHGFGAAIKDKRSSQGNLWVVADRHAFSKHASFLASRGVKFTYRKGGGRASRHQPAWHSATDA